MSGVVTMQLDELRERFGEAHVDTMTSGTALVSVPGVRLPHGWSKPSTTIRFLIPPGYPLAQPDCFWADADLRLAGGTMPQSSGLNAIPESGEVGLWFSWHLTTAWDPNRDTLSSWMNSIKERLGRVM